MLHLTKFYSRRGHLFVHTLFCCFHILKPSPRYVRYFGAFTDQVVQVFWKSFEDWELGIILSNVDSAGTSGNPTLELASPATIYRIVCDPRMLKQPKIHIALCALASSTRKLELPTEPPAVGLFYLCMDENSAVRDWARTQLKLTKRLPIPSSEFNSRYTDAIEELVKPLNQDGLSNPSTLFFGESSIVWSGLLEILRFVPDEFLRSSHACNVDFRHVVVGHLHDSGPRQLYSLRCSVSHLITAFCLFHAPSIVPRVRTSAPMPHLSAPSYGQSILGERSNDVSPGRL